MPLFLRINKSLLKTYLRDLIDTVDCIKDKSDIVALYDVIVGFFEFLCMISVGVIVEDINKVNGGSSKSYVDVRKYVWKYSRMSMAPWLNKLERARNIVIHERLRRPTALRMFKELLTDDAQVADIVYVVKCAEEADDRLRGIINPDEVVELFNKLGRVMLIVEENEEIVSSQCLECGMIPRRCAGIINKFELRPEQFYPLLYSLANAREKNLNR